MSYFLSALKQYAVFSGRARRTEYWMYILFYFIFALVAAILDNVLHLTAYGFYTGPIYSLLALALFLPSLAIAVRRLHDIGKAGTWVLISFIPIVGAIWLLVLLCTPGIAGPNSFGEDPKISA